MTYRRIQIEKKKKLRIKINSLSDLKNELSKDGYIVNILEKEQFIEEIIRIPHIKKNVAARIYDELNQEEHSFRVMAFNDLVVYVETIIQYEQLHHVLCQNIRNINTLIIEREEYERILCKPEEDVSIRMQEVEAIVREVSSIINEEEKKKLELIERQIHEEYVYAKDIELLKRMVCNNNDKILEHYNMERKVRTLEITMPKEIDLTYVKGKKGSVEYYKHIKQDMPRIERLIKNLHKYMVLDGNVARINQSQVLQDSINIAMATFDEKEYKAISGQDEIKHFCAAPKKEKAVFQSSKVNKQGILGIG